MESQPKRLRTWLIVGACAVGAAVGAAGIAGAATNGSSSSSSSSVPAATASPNRPNLPNPATMTHGPNETLLTGTTAEKVKSAALAAVPGGTIIRGETDSEGSPYEAHVTKSDGTQVTVKVDSSFKVTATEQGFGRGPQGGPGGPGGPGAGNGGPGAGYAPPSSSSTPTT